MGRSKKIEKDKKYYYWIKLKTDFFNRKEIDFLLSQKNGCEYIVLYQMLCLDTANNQGELCSQVGEMLIPYDIEKIVRDTKYFDFDTVTIALELFKKLGLIYIQRNNVLKITDFSEMVGCETKYAEQKRIYRERQKKDNVLTMSDKSKEYRDKIDIIDKLDKTSFHPLVNELIKRNYIEESDIDTYKYSNLFYELSDEYDYTLILVAINYVIRCIKSNNFSDENYNDIENRFGYFKTSLENNLEKLSKDPTPLYEELEEFNYE